MQEKLNHPVSAYRNEDQTEAVDRAHRAPIARYLFSAGGITALGLISIEIFLRLFVYGPGATFVFDPDLGKRFASGTSVFWGIEGHGTTRFVADGEIATPYTGPAQASIVVLGDSYTEAFQVDDSQKFVSIAETTLRQNGFDVDLHNLGCSGASIVDYVYMSAYVKKQYAPSAIVVQISRQDFETRESFDVRRSSHFVITDMRALEVRHRKPADGSQHYILRRIKRSFALVNYGLYRIVEIQKQYLQNRRPLDMPDGATPAGENEQLTLAESQRLQLEALAEAYRGILIVVLILPYTPYIETGRLIVVEPGFAEMLAVARGIDALTVAEPTSGFLALSARNKLPRGFLNTPPGIGHLNRNGHQIVGVILAQVLEEFQR